MKNADVTENSKITVSLLSMSWYRRKDPRIPLGMAYIYSSLKNKFPDDLIDITMIEADVRDNLTNSIHRILAINPDIIGIGVYAWNSDQTKAVIKSLRELGFGGIIVLGGPEITYGGNELNAEFPEVGFFVKGFGEIAFTKIIHYLKSNSWNNIPGVYKAGEEIGDILADPTTSVASSPFGRDDLVKELIGKDFARWQTQRGCVYRCTFCAFKMPNNGMIESDLATVEFELKKIAELAPKNVAVLDPVFFLNRIRAVSVLEMMKKITPETTYNLQTRFEHLNTDIIKKIDPDHIILECGLQTLNSEVQRRIKRVNNREKVSEIIKNLNARKIRFETHLIYGLPGQTMDSFASDIFSLKQMGCTKLRIFPLSLLRGTEIEVNADSREIIFSPVFPREVIKTEWMDVHQVYRLKELQKYLEDNGNIMDEEFVKNLTDASKVTKCR
jgi:radical SAM superfamily enzyme YgiQ (UPF0313 family)